MKNPAAAEGLHKVSIFFHF